MHRAALRRALRRGSRHSGTPLIAIRAALTSRHLSSGDALPRFDEQPAISKREHACAASHETARLRTSADPAASHQRTRLHSFAQARACSVILRASARRRAAHAGLPEALLGRLQLRELRSRLLELLRHAARRLRLVDRRLELDRVGLLEETLVVQLLGDRRERLLLGLLLLPPLHCQVEHLLRHRHHHVVHARRRAARRLVKLDVRRRERVRRRAPLRRRHLGALGLGRLDVRHANEDSVEQHVTLRLNRRQRRDGGVRPLLRRLERRLVLDIVSDDGDGGRIVAGRHARVPRLCVALVRRLPHVHPDHERVAGHVVLVLRDAGILVEARAEA
mmetsp:Transcript_64027/g.175836  ORF Transcript_64027/g.175836 Transcript_64027/m.175836 type:complete len:334 (-) Transcript_64027:320-1321(-)